MAPRKIHTTARFEKDAAIAVRRGKDTRKLKAAIQRIVDKQPIPGQLKDHPLKGNWKGYRDLHLEPDWILIYRVDEENLWLVRTGTHADLFGS